MARSINLSEHIGPILGSLKSVPVPAKFGQIAPEPVIPFVTISREVGAGAWNLAQHLCDTLNRADPSSGGGDGELIWTSWDRELVEKVAADFHLSQRLIESLGESRRNWLSDFFESFNLEGDPTGGDELTVFSKVARTVRALAKAGRVVLVGRGAVFLTHGMPGGVHVRLDAPLEHRIGHMMKHLNISHEKAAKHVHEMSKRRDAFFHRFWPAQPVTAELFTIAINTAEVSPEASVQIIASLVKDAMKRSAASPAPANV
jgi:cytidylate kinase